MKVVVDTSVWSEALRRGKRKETGIVQELRNLLLEHRVEMLGAIRQEVLSGVKDDAQFEKLEKHLAAFPDVPLTGDDYVTAAKFFNACRGKGVQGSNTDFLICAVAVRRKLAIFTTDQDFMHFAEHLPIVLHQARGCERENAGDSLL